jgi:hypothetical protein
MIRRLLYGSRQKAKAKEIAVIMTVLMVFTLVLRYFT